MHAHRRGYIFSPLQTSQVANMEEEMGLGSIPPELIILIAENNLSTEDLVNMAETKLSFFYPICRILRRNPGELAMLYARRFPNVGLALTFLRNINSIRQVDLDMLALPPLPERIDQVGPSLLRNMSLLLARNPRPSSNLSIQRINMNARRTLYFTVLELLLRFMVITQHAQQQENQPHILNFIEWTISATLENPNLSTSVDLPPATNFKPSLMFIVHALNLTFFTFDNVEAEQRLLNLARLMLQNGANLYDPGRPPFLVLDSNMSLGFINLLFELEYFTNTAQALQLMYSLLVRSISNLGLGPAVEVMHNQCCERAKTLLQDRGIMPTHNAFLLYVLNGRLGNRPLLNLPPHPVGSPLHRMILFFYPNEIPPVP